jgi:hypothetical protein
MSLTPGASLDNAIAGINRGVDNARKVATEINKESNISMPKSSTSTAGTTKNAPDGPVGGNLDVTA